MPCSGLASVLRSAVQNTQKPAYLIPDEFLRLEKAGYLKRLSYFSSFSSTTPFRGDSRFINARDGRR